MLFSVFSAILLIGLTIAYFYIFVSKKKKLPPGPIKWPLLGNIPQIAMADSKYAYRGMEALATKYGDIMSLEVGVHDACILSSYEAIKEILPRNDASDRYTFEFVTERAFHKTLGIIWSKGAMWSQIRGYTVKGLRDFGYGKHNSMNSIIQEDVQDLVHFFKKTSGQNNGRVEVNPHDFSGSIVNIIWSLVAGYRFPRGDPTVRSILEHGNSITEIVGAGNPYNALPFLKVLFPKWTKYDKHVICHREYQEFIMGLIVKAKTERATRQNTDPENFIELFLDEIERNKSNPATVFTEEQLVVVLMDLFLASSETTGNSITWSVAFLALYPNVQLKIKKEIIEELGHGPINIDDFPRLPYLKATILEVLRVGNIAPSGVPRTASNDIPVRDFIIPKGSMIMTILGLILSEKDYWGDPQVFRPERFLDETGKKLINTERVSLVFGTGKRMCLGEGFFWNAVPLYLATFLSGAFQLKRFLEPSQMLRIQLMPAS